MVQYWINDRDECVTVVDITKVKNSDFYRKRVRHDRYVVTYGYAHYKFRMRLSFDYMDGVRFWLRKFGYKLVK